MADLREVVLKRNAGKPEISVFIGQAQFGHYDVRLRTPNGKWVPQAVGDNHDDIKDEFPLTLPLAQLGGCVLAWVVTVVAPSPGPGQLYFVRLDVRQGGDVCEGGYFEDGGAIDGNETTAGAAKLVLK